MILIAIGANLISPVYGPPLLTCEAALRRLTEKGVTLVARSRWFRAKPVPPSGQPWFVNGIVRASTDLAPTALLDLLAGIEDEFGRVRAEPNAARVLDLDLIDHNGMILDGADGGLQLPHPRLRDRAFVLLPLADVAPDWVHPVSGQALADLIKGLDRNQVCVPMDPRARPHHQRADPRFVEQQLPCLD